MQLRPLTALVAASLLLSPGWAQAQTELDEPVRVSITGTGLPTQGLRNPTSISTITERDIRHRAPVSIATLLQDIPGLQISEEGIERIAIRGETSRRIAILIDGQKLTDHTEYGQPVMIDPTTIERIEVVRGASSVISGSSAIGGVVNIITKKGADKPLALSVRGGYLSATRGYRASASAGGSVDTGPGTLDYNLELSQMEQGDRRVPDGRLQSSDVHDRTASAYLGYRLGAHSLGLRLHSYNIGAGVYTGQPGFEVRLPKRNLAKTALFYEGTDLTPWLTRLSLDVYRQTINRRFASDITSVAGPATIQVLARSQDKQSTRGVNLQAQFKFWDHSRTVAGLQWENDGLHSDKDTQTIRTPPGIVVNSVGSDRARIRTSSIFAQHEHAINDEWTAVVGTRWYRVRAAHREGADSGTRDNHHNGFLGSAGLVWAPSNRLALRANLAQGYSYPTLGQLFLTTTGGGNTFAGNPNLKPERSTTYELGLRYNTDDTVLDAVLFHTRARDYIGRVYATPTGTFQNVDSARSLGLELAAEQVLPFWGLKPHASLLLMRRQLRYGNAYHTRAAGVPSLSGVIGVRKDWAAASAAGSVDLYLRGAGSARLRDADGALDEASAGWGTLNLRAHSRWSNGFSLVAELNNLANRRYAPFGQFPGARRSFNVFLNKEF